MSLIKMMGLLWAWLLVVTGGLSLIAGAPEPFIGTVVALLIFGVPLLFVAHFAGREYL